MIADHDGHVALALEAVIGTEALAHNASPPLRPLSATLA